jgi:hypothetical protein
LSARSRRLLVLVAAALAAVAHAVFWYLPRARAADPSARAAAALAAPGAALAIWIPYPHQNVGAIDDRLATLEARLAGLAGGGEGRIADLPRFGPFAVPPARELLLVVDVDGGRSAELAVYPAIRWLARAAGGLAGNPWLAGGELPGRPGESVTWSDGRWCWRRGRPAGPAAAAAAAPPAPEAYALLRTDAAIGPLPPGLYRLVAGARPRTLELVSGEPPASRAGAAGPVEPVGWLVESASPREGAADALRGVVVWDALAGIEGVPAMATLARGAVGGPEFDLPGEELLDLVGAEVPATEVGGIRVRALDRPTLDRGVALAGELAGRVGPDAALAVAAAADVDRLALLLERFADHLRRIPLVGGAEAREIERAAAALAPLSGTGRATLEVGPAGSWARLTVGLTTSSGEDVAMDRTDPF